MTKKSKVTTIIISLIVLILASLAIALRLKQIGLSPVSVKPKAEEAEDIFANVTPALVCQKNLSVLVPTLTPSLTPSVTPTPSVTLTPTATPTGGWVPTNTPRPTSTVKPTSTPRPTAEPTPEPTPTEIELPKAGLKIPTIGGLFGGFLLLAIGLALVF